MVTPPMPVHPHPRFGIGAIPIRGITLRYPNARSRGDKLFSKERGLPLDYPLTGSRFGLRLQPTGNTIIAALDERPGHIFEHRFHVADIANRLPQRSTRQDANFR
jgi:hypothetical protein